MALSLLLVPSPGPSGDTDRKVTLTLPAVVVHELKQRMAAEDTTMRALVLKALADAGYHVPAGELRDRRRR
jgi:hypothetical protein